MTKETKLPESEHIADNGYLARALSGLKYVTTALTPLAKSNDTKIAMKYIINKVEHCLVDSVYGATTKIALGVGFSVLNKLVDKVWETNMNMQMKDFAECVLSGAESSVTKLMPGPISKTFATILFNVGHKVAAKFSDNNNNNITKQDVVKLVSDSARPYANDLAVESAKYVIKYFLDKYSIQVGTKIVDTASELGGSVILNYMINPILDSVEHFFDEHSSDTQLAGTISSDFHQA